MLNTQQQETNDAYNTTFTKQQFNALAQLTKTWNAKCTGNYEDTFVGGVAHGYCDSGILTDGLSGGDIDMLHKYFTDETIYSSTVDIEQLENLVTQLEGSEWETDLYKFVRAVNGVLTTEQKLHEENATEAAMSYCWQCCD